MSRIFNRWFIRQLFSSTTALQPHHLRPQTHAFAQERDNLGSGEMTFTSCFFPIFIILIISVAITRFCLFLQSSSYDQMRGEWRRIRSQQNREFLLYENWTIFWGVGRLLWLFRGVELTRRLPCVVMRSFKAVHCYRNRYAFARSRSN